MINPEIKTIKCSSCEVPLVEILIMRPQEEIINHIKANCPHCEDQSFLTVISGGFATNVTKETGLRNITILKEETINDSPGPIVLHRHILITTYKR